MDDSIAASLRDIATELKLRNEFTRESTERSEARFKELEAKRKDLGLDERLAENLKTMREGTGARIEEMQAKQEERNDQRVAFQNALLTELRRLNENLEEFLARSLDSRSIDL